MEKEKSAGELNFSKRVRLYKLNRCAYMQQSAVPKPPAKKRKAKKQQHRQKRGFSCRHCHKKKIRCAYTNNEQRCDECIKHNRECLLHNERSRAKAIEKSKAIGKRRLEVVKKYGVPKNKWVTAVRALGVCESMAKEHTSKREAAGRDHPAVRQIKTVAPSIPATRTQSPIKTVTPSIPAALPKISSELTQPSFPQPLHSSYSQLQQGSAERSMDNLEEATSADVYARAVYQQAQKDYRSADARCFNATIAFHRACDRYNWARMSFFEAQIGPPGMHPSAQDCAQQPPAERFRDALEEASNAYVYARAMYQQAQEDYYQACDRYNWARMSFFEAEIGPPAKAPSASGCVQQPPAKRFRKRA